MPCWDSIALKGKSGPRQVFLVFDSDVMQKEGVYNALKRLLAFLESRGASVYIVYLPSGEDVQKVGLDDFIAANGGV